MLIAVAIPFMMPLFWLVTGTFKPMGDLLHGAAGLDPLAVDPRLTCAPCSVIPTSISSPTPLNTLYICAFNVIATVASCSLIAYGFARIRFPGRDYPVRVLIATLILPSWATLVPTYMIFKWLGWLGTFRPLTWPALFGDAFTIFLMRQFMRGIPMELSEAAYIDGASEFGIYWRVILPLVKPVPGRGRAVYVHQQLQRFLRPADLPERLGQVHARAGRVPVRPARTAPPTWALSWPSPPWSRCR